MLMMRARFGVIWGGRDDALRGRAWDPRGGTQKISPGAQFR